MQCRLINPAKNPIERISKKILDSITSKVKTETSLKLWKSTDEVINWFKTSVQKGNSRFIKFDICEFYPSITEELFIKALEYARSFVKISDEEADIAVRFIALQKIVAFPQQRSVDKDKQQQQF